MTLCVLSHLQKILNFYDTKFVSASHTILLGSLYSKEIILHVCFTLSQLNLTLSLGIAMVIYNPKIVLAINGKDLSSEGFLCPSLYFM